jgi:hypothetical protein
LNKISKKTDNPPEDPGKLGGVALPSSEAMKKLRN